ncbi:MAG: hypothetical protein E7413_00495 [Ruminococcaceae bacterium]|nr:hypothetical protein [Oscillospiraceae bacterium]
MKSYDKNPTKEQISQKYKKRKLLIFFIFSLITLFLLSFSTTTFILMNSYRLTFAGDSLSALQQKIGTLREEISRKDNEIEQLKLQIANIEGEASFVNQMQNHPLN